MGDGKSPKESLKGVRKINRKLLIFSIVVSLIFSMALSLSTASSEAEEASINEKKLSYSLNSIINRFKSSSLTS